ncbi:hypothetical protein HPB51_009097 [Rhipicephalus microplus]|uniref:Uncharacterized protein n=1 Tax=Rhipicephalus microplus TaxID=6941 RepID=A0A9J6F000_RHIMP|nr:hypothetical protein HPB51_009097 [Rhipicephalus microplus]
MPDFKLRQITVFTDSVRNEHDGTPSRAAANNSRSDEALSTAPLRETANLSDVERCHHLGAEFAKRSPKPSPTSPKSNGIAFADDHNDRESIINHDRNHRKIDKRNDAKMHNDHALDLGDNETALNNGHCRWVRSLREQPAEKFRGSPPGAPRAPMQQRLFPLLPAASTPPPQSAAQARGAHSQGAAVHRALLHDLLVPAVHAQLRQGVLRRLRRATLGLRRAHHLVARQLGTQPVPLRVPHERLPQRLQAAPQVQVARAPL